MTGAVSPGPGSLNGTRASATTKDGRKPRLPLRRVNPFDAENVDIALLEIGDEVADCRWT